MAPPAVHSKVVDSLFGDAQIKSAVFFSVSYQVWLSSHLDRERWLLCFSCIVKPVLSGHSKRIPKMVFKTDYR